MKKIILAIFLVLTGFQAAFATHYRAGVITYKEVGYLTYTATVTTYTTNIYVPPDRDTVLVSWGDGTSSAAPRINGSGVALGSNIKVNIYQTPPHTYMLVACSIGSVVLLWDSTTYGILVPAHDKKQTEGESEHRESNRAGKRKGGGEVPLYKT